jgi:hypothetical protein
MWWYNVASAGTHGDNDVVELNVQIGIDLE